MYSTVCEELERFTVADIDNSGGPMINQTTCKSTRTMIGHIDKILPDDHSPTYPIV